MQIPLVLDRSSQQHLGTQLANQLREAIRAGRIPAGARLPSSRELASQLSVGRNTVVRAFETLIMEGYVEARPASGMFATREPAHSAGQTVFAHPDPPAGAQAPMPLPHVPRSPSVIHTNRHRISYDFLPGRPNARLLPVKAWRRLLQGCLSYGGAAGFSESVDAGGLYALRAALAAHLSMSRGVVADPAQIIVTGGIQEGLTIAARLFLSANTTVLVEDPCYQGAALVFEAAGARVVGVPVDEEGVVTARLSGHGASLLYLTPAHQYPTGHTLSAARRTEVVEWARANACYILEDDYDSAFQYDGSPQQALAGIAPDCTIYLGTFSTTLGAGFRLGYMVVPPRLIDAVVAMKGLLNRANPWLDQSALAEFLQSGGYAAHVTRSRAHYRDSRDALVGALKRHFGNVEISGEAAGLHLLWQLPAGVPEAARLEELARRNRVGVYALESAAVQVFEATSIARRGLLLGFAGLTPRQIEQGIARLSDAVDDRLDSHHDFLSELLLDAPPPSRSRPAGPWKKPGKLAPSLPQQPALRTVVPRRAHLANQKTLEDMTTMRVVRGIYRYPIKGLSAQPVLGITLEAGKPFPFDRVFALARPGVPIDPDAPQWAKKGLFVMLMLHETLATVQTQLDPETMHLKVLRRGAAPGAGDPGDEAVLTVDLTTAAGKSALEGFVQRLVPALPATPRLLHAPQGHFMDKPDNVISCINLATIRHLEKEWGYPINPLRFRANFYIDGETPWEEFDWIGSDIMLGDVLFRVDRRNGRCGATNVNPATGERDLDIPGSLRKAFGHKDLGVYLVARTSGKVVVGDQVTVPESDNAAPADAPAPSFPMPSRRSFICRGCYFIYDESRAAPGVPVGTPFAEIGSDWRCPDCGTEKTSFRPYEPELVGVGQT